MAKAGVVHHLFGGTGCWRSSDWVASDDRVRGGKSESHLQRDGETGRFYGELDIDTLGGAGFASQRTTGEHKTWDLSEYDGIQLVVAQTDGKRYTLILKDTLLPKNPSDGREQSTTSYEFDFVATEADLPQTINIPWADFKPTYRGREQKKAKPLDKSRILRFSIMMRSFFGTQQGPFSISLKSISAYSKSGLEDLERAASASEPHRKWTTPLTVCFAAFITVAAVHAWYRRWVR